MLSDKLLKAINEQIKNELYSAYMYLAMSAHFDSKSLPGFARWTRLQAKEETEHAMKFYDFILDRGGKVELLAIDQPPTNYGEPLEIYKQILEHEKKVTAMIYNLYEIALAEKDYPAQVLLHWYIDEQVEEEKNASLIVDQLTMISDRMGVLINIDHHVGKRSAED
jgi:ferritin